MFIAILYFNQTYCQEDCKVLMPEIDSSYKGKCKKGLAHGKGYAVERDTYLGKFAKGLPDGRGIYTWENGNTYSGEWMAGKRHGIGKLIVKLDDRDSIADGIWENDEYMGPNYPEPRVITQVHIDRFSFKKVSDAKNRVLLNILQNGMRNNTVSNFLMSATKGVETSLGILVGYEFIEFPVNIKVSYMTLSKLKTQEYQAIFEFVISEPGDWRVEIHN
jgi:hypothetical protein